MSETTILKSSAINRNAPKSPAQLSGPLPVVQVSMTANGPQVASGQQARPVVVTAPKGRAASLGQGALPMVQVKMTPGGPQVNRSAVPATSQPRGVPRVAKIPPVQVAQVAQEQLSADQLMLCRHLVDKYLGELRASVATDAQAEGSAAVNAELAAATIAAIDVAMLARTTAEAEAIVEASAAPAEVLAPAAAPKRMAPPPRVVIGPRSVQAGSAVTPRRVTRPAQGGGPLPMVSVKMDGERPVVVDPPQPPSDQPELADLPAELNGESATTQG